MLSEQHTIESNDSEARKHTHSVPRGEGLQQRWMHQPQRARSLSAAKQAATDLSCNLGAEARIFDLVHFLLISAAKRAICERPNAEGAELRQPLAQLRVAAQL